MKSKLTKVVIVSLMIAVHIFWLLKARSYVTPELIFPVWLLSLTKTFISETQSMYAPLLFYLINFTSNFTQNLLQSIVIIQLIFVIVVDLLLFYYLNKKFGFKFAISGLIFYIPWQVFFRGNYLWFDFATIPFLAISFFYFEKYVTNLKSTNLILASTILSLGYFFKITVLWIYGLYFLWVFFLGLSRKTGHQKIVKNITILLCPLALVILANFLIVLANGTFSFAFYWNIIMQFLVYPRLPTLSRFLSPGYYSVAALMIVIYIFSCFIIERFSSISKYQKWFLYSFTLTSTANIFPRWSDFRVQPFLFFLTIIFIHAVYVIHKSKRLHKISLNFLAIFLFFSLAVFGNRIITEKKNSSLTTPNYLLEYAPFELTNQVKDRSVFVYDQPLYNHEPMASEKKLSIFQKIALALRDPDTFYRITNWQQALDYTLNRNPDLIIIPYQIHNRIISDFDLTNFERLILNRYQHKATIGKIYFVYARK